MSPSPRSFCLPLVSVVLVGSLVQARPSRAQPDGSAMVRGTLTASASEVFEALKGALSEWKMRKTSLEEGIVKTSWVKRERGREMFRDRVVAEFRPEGYVVHLSVRHERQRQARESRPVLGAPSAGWTDATGDPALARAVLSSVEEALGQDSTQSLESITRRPSPEPSFTQQRAYVVPPEVAVKVNALKAKRRDLVREVKAMDAEILKAVYAGNYDAIKDDVERLKMRKSKMEEQIAGIDREILQLVLAD